MSGVQAHIEGRRGVFDWQVDRDDVMSRVLQKRSQSFPTPRTVNQSKRCHAARVGANQAATGENRHHNPTLRRGRDSLT
jgi:hypothetical protein